ncbi:hypothetical protein EX895_004438 [Sporisorium graminicola]|uniref:C2H2-type domain-containing protein n=1 Tax=Sporisorium graminicola TaxID=280036 RepID=A0A4U7KS36_9BASI|nr:hypothetical protein EX895_004438 [Sporisorium graminicola]TKY86797.1 hypothetical protein EX895_004438 [Sporisorium graminicola]
MLVNVEPFGWSLNYGQSVRAPVGAPHAVSGSLVLQAVSSVNRPPSGDRNYLPEWATLNTSPSSCTPPNELEDRSLVMPPTVPTQPVPSCPSSVLIHDPFSTEEHSTVLPHKMEQPPMLETDYFGTAEVSGTFDVTPTGGEFRSMRSDYVDMQHDQNMHSLNPNVLPSTQIGPSVEYHIFQGDKQQAGIDPCYGGDVSLCDTSLWEYIHKWESPDFNGFEDPSYTFAWHSNEEPSLFSGSLASESSKATTEAWTPPTDPMGISDTVMMPDPCGSDVHEAYSPIMHISTPLSFPQPTLRSVPEVAFNQDRRELATTPAALCRHTAVPATLDPLKVALYHIPQQINDAPGPTVLPLSSVDVCSSLAPPRTVAPSEPAVQAAPVAASTHTHRTTARKPNKKAPIRIENAARQPASQQTWSKAATAPQPLDGELSHDCGGSGCGSQHDPHNDSASTGLDLLHGQHGSLIHVELPPSIPATCTVFNNAIASNSNVSGATNTTLLPRAPRERQLKPTGKLTPKRMRTSKSTRKPKLSVRYPCGMPGCSKTFSSAHNLNEHGQVHVFPRVKEFKCPLPACVAELREYYFKRDLRRHNRKVHPDLVLNA